MRSIVPPLSRLDEFTCDRVATAVVNDSDAVRDALTLLLVGPQLFSRVNQRALKEQADEFMKISKNERKSAESRSSHPLLLHRYAKISEVLRAPRPARLTSPQVQPTPVQPPQLPPTQI
jgi:Zn-dependent protease with chaperone function